MPRSSAGGGDRGATRGSGTNASANADDQGRNRTPVPTYSRPRDGRNPVGTAVERRDGRPVIGRGGYYYDPYYGRYWSPYGYGYGFGYFGYDPFLFGSGYGSYYSGYGSYYGGYGGYYPQSGYGGYRDVGALRLKVKPNNAQVYIDGYFVGVVDSFDGVFQRLGIESGAHRVELRAEGYETVQFEVMVTPGETITYKGELKRIR